MVSVSHPTWDVDLECGDIVLFSRACLKMQPFPAFLCLSAKTVHQSQFDHVGLVVENPSDGSLYLVEANMGGVTCHNLQNRLSKTSASTIAVRKLHGKKLTVDDKNTIWKTTQSYVGYKYNTSLVDMTKASLSTFGGHGHPNYHEERVINLHHALKSYQHYFQSNKFKSTFFTDLIDTQIKSLNPDTLKKDPQNDSNIVNNIDGVESTPKFYCSQLVADILYKSNILAEYKTISDYLPADYSSEGMINNILTTSQYMYSPNIQINKLSTATYTINPSKLSLSTPLKSQAKEVIVSKADEDSISYVFDTSRILPLSVSQKLLSSTLSTMNASLSDNQPSIKHDNFIPFVYHKHESIEQSYFAKIPQYYTSATTNNTYPSVIQIHGYKEVKNYPNILNIKCEHNQVIPLNDPIFNNQYLIVLLSGTLRSDNESSATKTATIATSTSTTSSINQPCILNPTMLITNFNPFKKYKSRQNYVADGDCQLLLISREELLNRNLIIPSYILPEINYHICPHLSAQHIIHEDYTHPHNTVFRSLQELILSEVMKDILIKAIKELKLSTVLSEKFWSQLTLLYHDKLVSAYYNPYDVEDDDESDDSDSLKEITDINNLSVTQLAYTLWFLPTSMYYTHYKTHTQSRTNKTTQQPINCHYIKLPRLLSRNYSHFVWNHNSIKNGYNNYEKLTSSFDVSKCHTYTYSLSSIFSSKVANKWVYSMKNLLSKLK